jgi:putative ABC transport system permease protein
MKDVFDEIRLAGRGLARRPGYACVAALTLALGIGANVAIFTVVNAVLLRPLPFPEADRIVTIRHHAPGINLPELQSSPGLIALYREDARTLTRLAGFEFRQRNLTGGGRPERVQAVAVTPELFDVLATRPSLGRPFHDTDAQEHAAPVAILTDALWRSRFGGDRAIVGQQIEMDGVRTEIVGVMPPSFAYPNPETRLLVPLWLDPARGFGTFGTRALARLVPGASLEAARAEIDALQRRISERFPDLTQEMLQSFGWSATLDPLRDVVVRDVAAALWILLGTVGLVLLIAGANVANLFLVRAESRQREVAIRSALGANRRRIASTFMAESGLLAFAGGLGGLALAAVAIQLLVAYGPAELPRLSEVGIDWTVIAFAAALTGLTALLLGVLPVARLVRRSFVALLRDGGRGSTMGPDRHRLRQLLVAGQVTVALVLLVGSALLLQSLVRLRAVDPGFRVDSMLTSGVSLGREPDRARLTTFYRRVVEEVSALPGVVAVGAGSSLPIGATSMNGSSFTIESRPRADDQVPPVTMYYAVMPGYFETLGIPLLEGRAPEAADADQARPIVWVNQTFASQFLGEVREGPPLNGARGGLSGSRRPGRSNNSDAIGERIRIGDDKTWLEIAGVVGDVRTFGLREDVRPMAYLPLGTSVGGVSLDVMHLVIRTDGAAASVAPLLRSAVDRVDPSVPLTSARTMTEIVSSSLAQMSFTMTLVALAAAIALVLGAVGLYGVISYIVSQRTAEIGVRMALGAQPRDVRSMVLRQGLGVVLVGIVVGVVLAAGATRVLASLLFEVSARDPATFATVTAVLLAVSVVAIYLPARRAAGIDPIRALREEA